MSKWRCRLRRLLLLAVLALAGRAVWSLWPPYLAPAGDWNALTGVTVINPGRPPIEDQTLILRDGRIESMRGGVPVNSLMPRWRQFRGRYVLPGVIDLDIRPLPSIGHLQQLFGIFFLYNGVTTVRVLGTIDGQQRGLQQRIDGGEVAWPRLVACGRLLEGVPPLCPSSRIVRDAAEATRAVAELASAGAACIAVNWTLSADALAAVRSAAASRGLPVVGDPPSGAAAEQSAIADRHLITAIPPQGSGRHIDGWITAWAGLNRDAIDAFARSAAAQPSAYVPNLFRWSRLAAPADDLTTRPGTAFMPRFYREVLWPHELAILRGADDRQPAAAVAGLAQATAALREAGVRVRLGSSAASAFVTPGFGLWWEALKMLDSGFTLEQVWTMLTREAGEELGIPQLGVIEEGAPADLLVFREDPTRDPNAFLTLEAVVTQGRLYQKPQLTGYLLELARYVEAPLYDILSTAMARVMVWGSDRQTAVCGAP